MKHLSLSLKLFTKFLLLFFTLTFITCEKNNLLFDSQIEIIGKSLYKVKTVKLSEIPKVRDFIIGKTSTNLFSRTTINGAIFDDDNILEVIDTLSNANYTFRFTYPDTPIGEFYNLVVGKTPNGELKTPFVLKYICDSAYISEFVENDFDFHFFKGTISVHKYTDFFEQGSIFGKTTSNNSTNTDTNCPPEYDENGDSIPCDTANIDGSGTTSGGGNGDGDPSGGDNGSGVSGGPGFGDFGSIDSGGDSNGGGGCTGEIIYEPDPLETNSSRAIYVFSCPASNRYFSYTTDSDCPSCPTSSDGGVGVLSEGMSAFTIAEILGFEENSLEYMWLEENIAERIQIGNYLTTNNNSAEAITFASTLINAWASNDFSELFALDVFNQDPYDVWRSLSQAEKDLIEEYPLEAYGIFKNREVAVQETITRFGNVVENLNGKPDAFRHAYYNVINAKVVGVDMAKLFSDAHESETPTALTLEKQMDLFNNDIGHQSISGNGSLSLSQLADLIYQKLLNGDLRYLSPIDYNDPNFWDNPNTLEADDGNHGITSSTQLIPTNQ